MARPKKYNVSLADDEVKELKSIIRKKGTTRTVRCRCQILLDLDEAHGKLLTYEQTAKSNGVCISTVQNAAKIFAISGIPEVITIKRSVNSDNARRKLDGRAEAQLIEIACSPAPEGHSRWSLRLLEEQAKIVLETPVGKMRSAGLLKKQNSPSQKRILVHSLKRRRRIRSSHGRCS